MIHSFNNEKNINYNKNYYRLNNLAYNLSYDSIFWDETDLVNFLQDLDDSLIDKYNSIKDFRVQYDVFKLLILYEYGGVYIDMNYLLSDNIDKLINVDSDESLYISDDNKFKLNFIACEKKNKMLKDMIDIILNQKNHNYNNLYSFVNDLFLSKYNVIKVEAGELREDLDNILEKEKNNLKNSPKTVEKDEMEHSCEITF